MSSFLELVNDVLRRTGQETVTTLTNAPPPARQVMDFINDIYFDILNAAQCNFLQASATITTADGTATYALAPDADVNYLLRDRIQESTSDDYMSQVDPTMLGPAYLDDTGKPYQFWIEGNRIRFYPVPNGVFTIHYEYLKRPVQLVSDADNSLIPLAWERLLVRGAESLLEKYLGEIDNSRFTYSLFLEGMALLKSRTPVKPFHFQKGFYRGYQP